MKKRTTPGGRRTMTCRWCGLPIIHLVKAGRPREFCHAGHRQQNYVWGRLTGDRITLALIAERDHYQCGICSGPVNMSAEDNLGPSIDHVIPVSAGGSSLATNLQLTHRGCNNAKRDRLEFSRPVQGTEGTRQLSLLDPAASDSV